jgi:Zn-finger nucleic acid-binding protein
MSCARVLDVSGLALGTRVRCACSALNTVAAPAPLAARALTCGRCGGAFQEGAAQCPWCDAGIVLADRRLAGVCGRCSARLAANARFCPGCGQEVGDQVVRPLRDLAGCPRCRAPLASRRVAERDLVECSSCGGIWLAPDVFEDMCARSEQAGTLSRMIGAQTPPTKPVDDTRVAYLKCPSCAEFMFRRNMGPGSGLILDVCKDHGVWFDHDELVRALEFAAAGGLERVREREKRRIEGERARRDELAGKLPVEPREFDGGPTPTLEDSVIDTIGTLARMLFGRSR